MQPVRSYYIIFCRQSGVEVFRSAGDGPQGNFVQAVAALWLSQQSLLAHFVSVIERLELPKPKVC